MIVLDVGLFVLALAFVGALVRAAIGPTLADRAAATDVALFTVVAALAVLSARLQTAAYVDAVLVATLLGFVATIALARLLHRRSR